MGLATRVLEPPQRTDVNLLSTSTPYLASKLPVEGYNLFTAPPLETINRLYRKVDRRLPLVGETRYAGEVSKVSAGKVPRLVGPSELASAVVFSDISVDNYQALLVLFPRLGLLGLDR